MNQLIKFLLLSLLAIQIFCGAENVPGELISDKDFQKDVEPQLQNEYKTLLQRVDKLPVHSINPILNVYEKRINSSIKEAFSESKLEKARDILRNFTSVIEQSEEYHLKDCSPCNTTDRLGYRWRACPNNTAYRRCKESGPESHYFITWLCGQNGKFVTEKPDNSQCKSTFWELDQLDGNLTESINKGQVPVKESQKILDRLFDFVERNDTGAYIKPYFGQDIPRILEIATKSVVLANKSARFSELENIGKLSLNTMLALLENQEPWQDLDLPTRSKNAIDVIENMETVAFSLLPRDGFGKGKSKTFPLRKNDERGPSRIILGRHIQQNNRLDNITFSDKNDTTIVVKVSAQLCQKFNISEKDDIKYVGTIIEPSFVDNLLGRTKIGSNSTGIILPGRGNKLPFHMNGKLLSFTLKNTSTSVFNLSDSTVRITFRHNVPAFGEKRGIMKRRLYPGEVAKAVLGESTCAYWDTQNSSWSTFGCRKILEKSNSTVTVCECSHLSTFAVLTGYHSYYPSHKTTGLEIITWILSGLSMFCLTVSVVIFTSVKGIRTEQTEISTGLCISLIVGNILLLLADKNNYSSDKSNAFCVVIGMMSHYAWLSVFGWMAVEGIHLYHKVVKVFASDNLHLFKIYCFLGYGVPAIIVAITALAGHLTARVQDIYVGDVYCWLTGNNVWAFMGPVLIVVTGNFVVLCVAVHVAISRRIKKGDDSSTIAQKRERSRIDKKLIIGTTSLSFLLGIAWSIGFFTMVDFEEVAHVFSYIFTLLNASQGIFIFVFHCILNETVRQKVTHIITSRISVLSKGSKYTSY